MSVSIVILCVNETQCILKNLLDSVVDQTVKPAEIILIDASKNKLFKDLFYSYETSIHKLYHSEPGSYPGNSRNIGVSLASSELIGFLDIKTIPSKDWLNSYIGYIEDANCDLIFGETYFHASSFFF